MVFLVVSRYRLAKSNRAHLDKVIFIFCDNIKGKKEGASSNPDGLGPLFFVLPFSLKYAANSSNRPCLTYYYVYYYRHEALISTCCNVCVSFHVMRCICVAVGCAKQGEAFTYICT